MNRSQLQENQIMCFSDGKYVRVLFIQNEITVQYCTSALLTWTRLSAVLGDSLARILYKKQ